MKLTLDTKQATLHLDDERGPRAMALYSPEAFEALSRAWLKVGWSEKHLYTFSWLGRPVIQLPDDMIRIQEVIYRLKPDVIIETGVAHGGSLVFYASLCKAIGNGRIVGVDIEIRPHNRAAIEEHELFPFITLIEGDSVAPEVTQQVRDLIKPGERVLVILDSNHSKGHVLAELEAYAPLVTIDSYIVATDGIIADAADVPRGDPSWAHDNPTEAALSFAREHADFEIEQPAWPFNESTLTENVTHWPAAWIRRTR